jgi:FtsP/CotA-like multicopper oxidase with cupredoxin domain
MIQIGTEGGLLPAPVVIPATPIGYNYNRRDIVVLNVSNHALLLGPAERADVIIDFSSVPSGSKLILYNDAPAPVPAFDPRYDYYTGNPDQTSTGGAPATLPGYGPNTRTIMQIRVEGTAASAFNLSALEAALPAAYAASQPVPIVPEAAYGPAFNATFQDNYVRIQDTSFTFQPAIGGSPITFSLQPKAIQELFDPDYGRMNSTLGVEIPFTSATTQTTIPYFYIDPPTEVINNSPPPNLLDDGSVQVPGGTQIWKITHNGVDTHAIHFHLFNVQLINRVGWDGAIRPPDPNELGWKDTVRMNPLEDAIVALRPAAPTKLPFKVPNSIRPLDVTRPLGSMMGFTNIDPNGNPVTVTNQMVNFGWEYVWHCHLLGHEENDMMRPFILAVAPEAPSNLTAAGLSGPLRVSLTWKDNSLNETGFTLQRATDPAFTANVVTYKVGTLPDGAAQNYIDTAVVQNTTYYYRVFASNEVGSAVPGYPTATADSMPSNTTTVTTPSALSNLVAAQHGIIKE